MKKQTIATAALGLVAFGSIGLNIFQTQSAAGMDQNYKAQMAKIEDLKGKLKDTQAIYNSAHLASARQYYMLIHLSELCPDEFNRVADMAQHYSDADLVKSFDNVGTPIPKQPTKESSATNAAATVAESATQSSTTNAAATTPESTTQSTTDNVAATAAVPSFYDANNNEMTVDQYKQVLAQSGFTNVTVSHQPTTGAPHNYVYDIAPDAGAVVSKNTEIEVNATQ